ncbi:MAG: IPT/TIG domain-containing protein [bacterium]
MARSILRILFTVSVLAFAAGVATAAHFPDPTPSAGGTATTTGTPTLTGGALAGGDEVAVFSVHGRPGAAGAWERTLIGHAVVDNAGILPSLTIFGDDGSTPGAVEGAVAGEEICLVLWKASEDREYGAYVDVSTGLAGRLIWQPGGSLVLSGVDFRAGQRIPLRNGAWNLVSYGALSGYHTGSTPPSTPQLRNPDGTQAFSWQPVATLQDAFPLRSIQGRYTQIQATDSEGTKMFDPALSASTLTYLAPGYGYWISMVADNQALSWMTVPGAAPSGQESLALQSGLNLVGVWDNQVYIENGQDNSVLLLSPVSTPLVDISSYGDFWAQSAGTSYQQVQSFDASGALTWDPLNADFSTLKYAAPGSGYYIVMFTEGSLRYPFSSAPLGVAAVAGDNQVTVSWKAVPGADSYTIYWSNLPGVKKGSGSAIPINSTSYDHTGLTNGVPYYYVVTVTRGGLESGESAEVSATPASSTPAPTITSFAPSSGKVDDLVFIDGTGFVSGATTVSFNGTAATVALLTDNQVIVPVPTGATTGSISVTTPGGTATSAGSFEVLVLPTIGSVAPMRGPAGTVVTVTGTAFDPSFTIVEFNGLPSTSVTVVDPTHVSAVVPAGATDGFVTVITRVGGTGVVLDSADLFRVISAASVTPSSGPVGTTIAIAGTNFDNSARLFFANGASADNVVYVSPTRLNARVSAGAASGLMRLEFAGVSTAVTTPTSFLVIPAPVISGFLPARAPAGTPVAILGAAFDNVTAVRFGATPASFDNSYTSGRLVATVPSLSAGPVTVSVDASGGSASASFDVKATPAVSSVVPSHGAIGMSVVLSGSDFDNTFQVSFNGITAPIVSLSSTRIDTRVPTGATTGQLALTFNGMAVGSGGGTFTVDLPPVISDFSPTIGKVGTTVTVTGQNFDNTAIVRFNGRSAVTRLLSSTQVEADVPNGATTGSVSVSTGAGMVFSGIPFRVVAVTGVSPDIGAVGASVTVSGTNFDNTAQVSFGGASAATAFVNATTLTATVPSGATTGLVSVSTSGLSVTGTTLFRVVSVTGVSPSAAASGSSVAITGTFFDNTSQVRFFDNVAATVTARSATSLTATVPSGAGMAAGPVTVVTQGIGASSPSAFTPALAPSGVTAVPGDNQVTLSWSPVTGAASYKIYWGTAPGVTKASVTFISGATSPYLHAGRANGTTYYYVVTATTSGVESAISAEVSARPVSSLPPAPTLDGITPVNIDRGKAGETVHVYGANFVSGGTSVSFNGVPGSVSVIDNTHLQASVPPSATTGPIVVSTAGGFAATPFAFRVASVSDFNPKTGKTGDNVAVTGTAFDNVVEVRFGGIGGPTASFTVPSDNQVNVTVPATAIGGKIWVIQGRTDRKTGASVPLSLAAGSDFTFLPAPTISSFTPPSGSVGTTVTVNGANLDNAAVALNGVSATVTPAGAGQFSFTVPSTATTGMIAVTTPGGTVSSGTNFLVVPQVVSFSPAFGVAGDNVIITGSGFDNATTVSFHNGAPAVPVTVVSPTELRVTVPDNAVTGMIAVATAGGAVPSAGYFHARPTIRSFSPSTGPNGTSFSILGTGFDPRLRYVNVGPGPGWRVGYTRVSPTRIDAQLNDKFIQTGPIHVEDYPDYPMGGGILNAISSAEFIVVPTIDRFSPASGTEGTLITIDGGNFDSDAQVRFFDNVAATVIARSIDWVRIVVPPSAQTGPITIVNRGASAVTGTPFTMYYHPAISNVSPLSGAVGDNIVITGTNFDNTVKVYFNGVLAPVTSVTSTQIRTNVPPSATTGPVYVATTGGGGSGNFSSFTVTGAPAISSVSPTSGPAGTDVTINGTYFQTGVTSLFVRFNGVLADNVTVVSDNQVTAKVPAAAGTGPVSVTSNYGTAYSPTNFVVTASVASFTPQIGTIGAPVTIDGSGFDPSTQVKFNGVLASSVTVSGPQRVIAIVPPGATSGPLSVVTFAGGTVTTASPFHVVSITGISPTTGPSGATVNVSGTYFDNATTVRIDGVAAGVSAWTDNSLTFTVPSNAITGKIYATVQGWTAASAATFFVQPTISGFAPPSGSAGDNVTISGANFDNGAIATFNGALATVISRAPGSIVAAVPPTATTGRIFVTTAGGTVASGSDFTVQSRLSGFTPPSAARGATVSILGSGFVPSSQVSFNGIPATASFVSAAQLNAIVPDAATTGKISVTTPSGTLLSDNNFLAVPSITGFTPFSGNVGAVVTVDGYNFDNTAVISFNGTPSVTTRSSALSLSAPVPFGATTGKISVTTLGGAAVSAADFVVIPFLGTVPYAPDANTVALDHFDGGTAASILGFYQNGQSCGGPLPYATPGYSYGAGPSGLNQALTLNPPAGYTAGSGTYLKYPGELLSQSNGTIEFWAYLTSWGQMVVDQGPYYGACAGWTFALYVSPTGQLQSGAWAAFSMDSGTAKVPLNTWTHLAATWGSTGAKLYINGVQVGGSASTGRPAPGYGGSVLVRALGTWAIDELRISNVQRTTFNVAHEVPPAPTISSISPASGPVGTPVTISGSYFDNSAVIRFAGGVAATRTVVSSSQIDTVVPVGAVTGPITVTTSGGTAVSTQAFTTPKLYDAREYLPLRLGDYSLRQDGYAGITHRTRVIDNVLLTFARNIQSSPNDYTDDLFAFDPADGKMKQYGVREGNPRVRYAYSPGVVVGSNAMAVGDSFANTYTVTNTITGFTEGRASSFTFEAVESVTTPAGTFDNCVKISFTDNTGGSGAVWLARGIGVVQERTQAGALNPATYIMANGVAYGTPPARIPAGDNVAGLYGLDVTTSTDGLVNEKNIYNIVHNAGTNALDVTRFSPTAIPASHTGSVGATDTAFTLHGLTTTSQPMTVSGVFTPNAEAFVGQWWVDATPSVKYPLSGVLAYANPPQAGGEAIYLLDGGSAGIKDSLYAGPLTYAGDNTAFRRDNFSGLAAAGAPMGLQEWFSVQNLALMELGNSVWPVYVPSLRLLPKRYVLNETYTVFSWLDGSSSSFKVDSVDNVVVPAGTFPLSVRIAETVSKAGYPDTTRYSWITGDTGGMVHVKAQDGAHVEELMWYRVDGNPYGSYPANAPTVTSFSPASGSVGSPVSIYGVNFDNSAVVTFSGGAAASRTVVSSTQIDATVPGGAVSGPIRVTQGGITSVSPASFTLGSPTITSFTPDNGVYGASVTIYGTNFDNTASVYFYNGVLASSTYVSSTELHATVPSGSGTGSITVTAAGGTAVSAGVFTVAMPPGPPDVVSALGVNGAVAVSWTRSVGGTTFNVYRGISAGVTKGTGTPVYSGPGSVRQFTDNGVVNGTAYYYVVTASNVNGESAESMEVSATPTASATVLGGPTPYMQKRQTGTGSLMFRSWIDMKDPATGISLDYTAVVAGSGTVTGPGGAVPLSNQWRQSNLYVPLDNTGNPGKFGGLGTMPAPAAGDLPTGFYRLTAVDNAGRTFVRDAWYDNSVASPGPVDTATMSGTWGGDGSLTFSWSKPAGMTTSANPSVRMRVVIQTATDVNGDGTVDWVYMGPDVPLNDNITLYSTTVDAASMAYLKARYVLDALNWQVQARHNRNGYEVYRHNSNNLNLPSSGAGPAAYSISGTVSGGTGSGRIYLQVQWSGGGQTGYGTSVGSSGSYTIRGVPPGSYVVMASRDLLGTGIPNAADPAGTSGVVNLTSGNVVNANVLMSNPSPFSPTVPGDVMGIPGDSGALVFWDTPKDGMGREIAASYNLYWHTDNTVSPSTFTGSATGIKARDDGHYFPAGLANGSTYYFVATASLLDNVTTSAPSPVSAPVLIGTPVGGHTISGTVTFPGVTPTGPLYIALGTGGKGMPVAVAGIASPTSPQAFSISGVPDGLYSVYAILDQNNNHVIDVGDLANTDAQSPIVTVSGGDVPGVSAPLPTGNAVASVQTSHGTGSGEWYNVNPTVDQQRKLPVKVVLAGGPNVPPVVDIGKPYEKFQAWIATPRPNVGDNYVLNVTYSDNTTEVFVRPVTTVLDSFATPTHPVGVDNTAGSTTPTFAWTAPVSPPATYSYHLYMNGPDASWNTDNEMPSTQTSVPYNVDGRASSPSLTIGNTYNWTISVEDAAGNQAQYQASFTPGIPIAPPSPTITSFTPDNGVFGASVTIYGTNFDNTASVYFFNSVLASSTYISSTELHATVPAGASTGAITVTTSGGTAVSGGVFTVPLPPSPPAGVSALGLNGSVVVSWSGVSGTTTFKVYRGGSPGVTKGTGTQVYSGPGSVRQFTDNAVANGTPYYYVVTSSNVNGESAESLEVTATPTGSATVFGGATPYMQKRQTGTGSVALRSWIEMKEPSTGISLEYSAIVAGSGTTSGPGGPLALSNQWRQSNLYVPLDNTGNPGGKFGGISMEPSALDLPTGFYRVSGVDNAGRTFVRDAWYDNSVTSPGPVDTATMGGTWNGDGSLTLTWNKPAGMTTSANPSVQMRAVITTKADVNGDGLADWAYISPNVPLNDNVTVYSATVDAASMAYLKSRYVLDALNWQVQTRHNRSGFEVYRHNSNNVNLPVSGSGPSAYSISGTVSGGTGSGRIYLQVQWSGGGQTGYGTSVGSSGSYTIRGVPPGSYVVMASRDLLGTGIPNAADPAGVSGVVNLASGNVTGANVTMSDPTPFSPEVPGDVMGIPGDGGALVFWDTPQDGMGREIAASYNLYWHTDNTVSPTNFTGSAVGIKARDDGHYFASGLTNGSTYWYVATATLLDNVTTSAPSAVSAPVTIGAPVGGHMISGTVTFPGVVPTGPLYIALVPGGKGMPAGVAGIANPTSPQAFSVPGVPDGTYSVYAILDQNQNHVVDVGDLSSTDSQAPIVTVSGGDVSGVSAGLPTGNAQASVRTGHGAGSFGEWFNVSPTVSLMRKLPVKVVLAGGPNVPPVVDIGKGNSSSGEFNAGITTPRPNVGDNYVLNVTYSDNTTEVFVRSVAAVLDSFATPTHPVGVDNTADSTTPTFTWTAPASPPVPYSYFLWMNGPDASWNMNDRMSSTQTSVLYNFDGRASSPSLTIGNTYNWTITVEDAAGNQAQYQTSFTPGIPVAPPSPTITSFTPDNGVFGTAVTIYGSNFDNTASVYFYNSVLASSRTVVSPSQIDTTVPSGASTGAITVTTSGGTAVSGTSFTVPLPPSPPAGVSALGLNGAVVVSWTGGSGGGATYKVYRGTSPGVTKGTGTVVFNAVLPGMKVITDNTGIVNSTPYYYVVTASNVNGESAESMEVTATPTASATVLGGAYPFLQKRQTGTGGVVFRSWIDMKDPATGISLDYGAVVIGSGTVTGAGGPVSLSNQWRQSFVYVPLDNTGNPAKMGGMVMEPSPAAGDLPTGFYRLGAVDNAGRTFVRDAWYDNSVTSPGTVDNATMSGTWNGDGSLTFTWNKPAGMTTSAYPGAQMRAVIQTKTDVNGDGLADWVYMSPNVPLNDNVTTYGATVDAASMAYLKAQYVLDGLNWHVEVRHYRSQYEVYRHNSINLNLPSSGAGPAAYSISGTVSGGTGGGRIYVSVQWNGGGGTGYGTSVGGSGGGSYTIRGVPPGSYQVTAYRDLLGTGLHNAADPSGTSGTVTVTSGNVVNANVTMSDPTPFSPSTPGGVTVVPGDGGAMVFWDTPMDGMGHEIAASYSLYWHTDNTVSPTTFTGSATGIKARDDGLYIPGGLVNGNTYYFVATASLLDNTTSSPSPVSAPGTIGAGVGGRTISGTVSYPGVTPTGPLYIGLGAGGDGMPVAVAGIPSPTPNSQSFSISGLPDGTYGVYAILDQNNNHVIDLGDLTNTNGNAPVVTVSGADASGVSAPLPTGNAVASVRTSHGMGTGEWFNVIPTVSQLQKLPVKVVLAGGPNVPPVVDIAKSDWEEFQGWIGTPRPNVGDNYILNVTYSDNTTEVFTRSVTAVLDSFATPTHPVGVDNTAGSTTPTFTWTAPVSPPATYSYDLWMNGPDAQWNTDNRMPSTQTSILYNVDGRASSPSLTIGNTYYWTINVNDAAGNQAQYQTGFTPMN